MSTQRTLTSSQLSQLPSLQRFDLQLDYARYNEKDIYVGLHSLTLDNGRLTYLLIYLFLLTVTFRGCGRLIYSFALSWISPQKNLSHRVGGDLWGKNSTQVRFFLLYFFKRSRRWTKNSTFSVWHFKNISRLPGLTFQFPYCQNDDIKRNTLEGRTL